MNSPRTSFHRRIWLAMLSIGPGIFCIGYTIGTGSVTSMVKSGSQFGMQLLWVLLLSCLYAWVLMVSHNTLIVWRCFAYTLKKMSSWDWSVQHGPLHCTRHQWCGGHQNFYLLHPIPHAIHHQACLYVRNLRLPCDKVTEFGLVTLTTTLLSFYSYLWNTKSNCTLLYSYFNSSNNILYTGGGPSISHVQQPPIRQRSLFEGEGRSGDSSGS